MSLPPRSSVGFWGFLTALTALTFVRIDLHARPSAVSEPGEGLAVVQADVAPVAASLPAPKPHRHVIADTLGPDESIYLALKRHRVSDLQITLLSTALSPVLQVRKDPKPGDFFRLELDSLHAVARFEYTPLKAPDRPVLVERQAEELVARRWQRPVTETTETLRVFIEDNLFNAIASTGENDALTDLVVDDVFGSVLDFHTVPRHGDRLGLVFTRQSVDGRFLRYGKILMALYEGESLSRVGVYYEDPAGAGDYYDETGESLERMFLLKPMSFRRISSPFSRRRFHPILKRHQPHLGTDYAAAPGTPVWSTAHGVVTHAGWNGGYGKMVEIKHANGYRTRYAHLSRILVRKGQRVSKSDHVGHVGATGRATGPHLHYELIQNGRHINPASVNGGAGRPLAAEYRPAFQEHYRSLRERLDKSTGAMGPLPGRQGSLTAGGGALDFRPPTSPPHCNPGTRLQVDQDFDKLEELVDRDRRYKQAAYLFVHDALQHTVEKLGKADLPRDQRNVSGRDLAFGISEHALDRFGPLALSVFEHWGIRKTRDFGEIVFNLVEIQSLRTTEDDRIEDFDDVFDLDEELDWKRRRAEFRRPRTSGT